MKKPIISLLLMFLVVSALPTLADTTAKKHVLLLNSYAKGYAWTDNIVRGVEKVPVLFCGVNNFTKDKVNGFSLYTGANKAADFPTTLSLMFKRHPGTKRPYVINDQLTTASFLKKEFLKAAQIDDAFIQFVFLENISMTDLRAEVSTLSRDSSVFYLSFFKDNTGKSFNPGETAAKRTQTIPEEKIRADSIPMRQNNQYIVAMRQACLQSRKMELPAIYEAFGRATENFIEKQPI